MPNAVADRSVDALKVGAPAQLVDKPRGLLRLCHGVQGSIPHLSQAEYAVAEVGGGARHRAVEEVARGGIGGGCEARQGGLGSSAPATCVQ